MSTEQKTRVAMLGVRETEVELLAELHRNPRVELVGVYDPDPHAVGQTIAELLGVPRGSDRTARDRLVGAEVVVLPSDRYAVRTDLQWCSGLRSELVNVEQARSRWGSTHSAPAPDRMPAADVLLESLEAARERLGAPEELCAWLVDVAIHAVGGTGGSLQVLSRTTNTLYLVAARGLSEQTLHHSRRALGEPIAGVTAETGRTQIVQGRHPASTARERGALESALSVPLRGVDGSVIGVVNVSTTIPGRSFGKADAACLEGMAPRLALLLQHALDADTAAAPRARESLLRGVRASEARGEALQHVISHVCDRIRQDAEAENVALYLATEDGEWRLLCSLDRSGVHRHLAQRDAAVRAFLENRWVQLVETTLPTVEPILPQDPIDAAVDVAIQADPDLALRSCVYAPLVGTRPAGVLAVEFRQLAGAERFLRRARGSLESLALFLEARVGEHRARTRIEALAQLVRHLPALFGSPAPAAFDATVLSLAADLVGAHQVVFRRVDERRRTFSAPAVRGVPDNELADWRRFDTRVTETTLQRRAAHLTTALGEEHAHIDEPARVSSLLSVPVWHDESIVAVLTAYNKVPRHFLDDLAFNTADGALLEDLAVLVAAALVPSSRPALGPPAASETAPGIAAGVGHAS
jgi:putative methionine-R-sulfoxide reductase with GAF domain